MDGLNTALNVIRNSLLIMIKRRTKRGCDEKKWHLVSLCTECNSRESHNRILYEFLLVSNLNNIQRRDINV
jgi:hypothetical protein